MKLESIKEVADLKKPVYPEDGTQDIEFTDQCLLSAEELERFMTSEAGGKSLVWINTFIPITDHMVNLNATGETNKSVTNSQKTYKGQWRMTNLGSVIFDEGGKTKQDFKVNENSIWEGIGII